MWLLKHFLLLSAFLLWSGKACIQVSGKWKQVSVEEKAKNTQIVFHGLAIETLPIDEHPDLYAVQFWLINVYKGAESVGKYLNLDPGSGGVFNLRDRKINVTGFSYNSKCHSTVAPQKYYIIFCELGENELVAKLDVLFGSIAEWSEKNERRVWRGVGWENWSDWGTCSTSCGEGFQERTRKCVLGEKSCHGYNKERRRCNMFSCQGAVDPMKLDDRRFFHPSRGEWQRVSGRPAAWKLRPNSYIWVPSSQIFPDKLTHRPGSFPREFSLLVTLKLSPKKPLQGTLFSLRSRREQNAYLSLELEAPDRIRVVHAGKNGTQAVIIPMKLNDGRWHQLGLALQDDNSVRSFLDCAWVSTDILKRNELDHPEDADLIIGYLFQGELEQLVIVPNPGAVAQQCSSSKIPIYDPTIENEVITTSSSSKGSSSKKNKYRRGPSMKKTKEETRGRNKGNLDYNFNANPFQKEPFEPFINEKEKSDEIEVDNQENDDDDDSFVEGSGNGLAFNKTNYEVEWSDWSPCSTTCGPGTQMRRSRCIDDGNQLELCVEAGNERTESRSCILRTCASAANKFGSTSQKSGDGSTARSGLVTSSPTENYLQNDLKGYKNHLNEEILIPSDIYFSDNHTVVAKKHHHHGKLQHGRPTANSSWEVLKKHLARGNVFRKTKCSCLNGGVCEKNKNVCNCPEGYWGRYCENAQCEIECMNGGRCVGNNVCSCPAGFHGPRCEIPKCDPPCRNGGTCIKPYTCLCPDQTAGSYCQKYYCRFPCLNGGSCVGPDQCECPHNATGRHCENPVCEPPCENGATCSSGNWCVCDTDYYGIRCEKRKCKYVTMKVPVTRGFGRMNSKTVQEKCQPTEWKSCGKTVPEFQIVYKTLYKTVYKCKEDKTDDEQHQ